MSLKSVNSTGLMDCNGTEEFEYYNATTGELYVTECLGHRVCIPVSECASHIEAHINPNIMEWVVIAIYSIIFFMGLFGNGLVIAVVLRTSRMRTVVNIFIVNLAIADFLVLLVCLPPSVLADTTESWYLGEAMCKVVPFLQTVSVAVSVLTLGAISIERYFAICHPLRRRLTALQVSVFIVLIWVSAGLIALPELLYQQLYRSYPEHVTLYLQYCRPDMPKSGQDFYQIFRMVALYDVPMCLMFFAYITISHRLWKDTFAGPSSRQLNAGTVRSFSATRPVNQLSARRKAAKMLMTIVGLFALCYLPVHILNILKYNKTLHTWDSVVVVPFALISRGLCYLNSSLNPVIYNFMSGKFRQEFRAAFSKCHGPFQEAAKTPVTLYNFRVTRTNGQTRSERYSMNTLTTRQGYTNQINNHSSR